MEFLMEILGWAGAVLVLGAYALLSAQKLSPHTYRYHGLNLLGSVLLAGYAFWHYALASVAVNVIWMGIGLTAVFSLFRKRARTP